MPDARQCFEVHEHCLASDSAEAAGWFVDQKSLLYDFSDYIYPGKPAQGLQYLPDVRVVAQW